tara:strand:+ start:2774 stop:3238 length:465 start_codon:yes stop_codon:yes gene_type:complete
MPERQTFAQAKNKKPIEKFKRVLLPEVPRDFPWRRGLRVCLRAVHIWSTAILLGGHFFTQSKEVLLPWLLIGAASGAVLLLTDLYASFAILFELRGILVLFKVLCVAAAGYFWDYRFVLLTMTCLIGALSSHATGKFRHHMFFLKDTLPDKRRG